jgi:CheY-like chemotaxis protein
MDLHMPIMDGYEATKGIRSFDQDVPIMALTADAITGVEEKCKSYGFTHFMSKPFVPEAFARTIGDLLSNTERGTTAYKEDEVDHALWNRDLGLKMLGGNEKLFDEVLNVYLAENVQTLDELKFYYDQRSYEEAAKLVHKVKSSTGSIGSDSVRQLASELQQALEASNEEQITLFYNRFNTQFAKLLDVIKEKNK